MDIAKKIITAKKILKDHGIVDLKYLGHGTKGIVFHNNTWVYKIIIPSCENENTSEILSSLHFFLKKETYLSFYQIEELINTNEGYIIQKYKYEESEKVTEMSEHDIIIFLTECWQKKIVVKDCKKENFIRVNKQLKLIDMDSCVAYNDNLFLNACARLYLYTNFPNHPDITKLQRSAINNFEIKELEDLRIFVNKVFANIIYSESASEITSLKFSPQKDFVYEQYSTKNLPNLEKLFFNKLKQGLYLCDIQIEDIQLSDSNTFETRHLHIGYRKLLEDIHDITLLIKTCAMDVATIEQNVKHIVRQLSSPRTFKEIVIVIDSKQTNFLRQYTEKSNYNRTIEIISQLQKDNIIDRFIIYDPQTNKRINKDWFNIESDFSHSSKNIPIASQLYGFENCTSKYILQADSDVLIGRKDLTHDFLSDMVTELVKNEKVISVGFNIYNSESKPYFGFENGGFVPEVRFGLIHKERILKLRPLPNSLNNAGILNLSWYRSLEQHQKTTGYCSIRGGDNRTFYIHPQNYRKTSHYAWMLILDRVEQLEIPPCQYNHFDCEGSLYDWCGPKRNEKMVILSCFKNVSPEKFLRFWFSLISQTYTDFGIILYDDNSDNGISTLIEHTIKSHKNKVTFIRNRNTQNKIKNIYLALSKYCSNEDSIIVCVDTDDALIGKHVLEDVYKVYSHRGVDMTCGRVHQTYRIQAHYRYPVDFVNPRTYGGNTWQHLKTFKKYLFDSIPIHYFKYDEQKKISQREWLETCDDYAFMIPITEMSKSPYQMEFINYYYERDYNKRNENRTIKDKCIEETLRKKPLNPSNVKRGRIAFNANINQIEIDITFDCNLKCKGCNRSWGLAPSKEMMSVTDVVNFIQDSINNNKKWKRINILGGEPTIHPNIIQIMEHLQNDYADKFNPDVYIQFVSNGLTKESREICDIIEKRFSNVQIDRESYKTKNSIDYFSPFCDAPCDDPAFKNADYSRACWVASCCGIGLNKNGYYGCSVCGGIDRIIGKNKGKKHLSELTEEVIKEHFYLFCRYCGNFKHYASSKGNFIPRCEKSPFKEIISPTWEQLYLDYNKKQKAHED